MRKSGHVYILFLTRNYEKRFLLHFLCVLWLTI